MKIMRRRFCLFSCAAILALVVTLRAAAAEGAVEQWGVFEIALDGPTNGNPFTDVTFSARFTQGAASFTSRGFYDGGQIYRVRFTPPQTGSWQYITESNARELDGRRGSFNATAPDAGNHGPVRVAHTYHFAYADGTPYWEIGTTCYDWIHANAELQAQTLKTLAASPFNKLRMCVFPQGGEGTTNQLDVYPFSGTPNTNWDFTRPNPEFFRRLEQRILDLQKVGIEADVILFHPYDRGHWGFDRMPAEADDRYLRYVVARLAAYRNVWWSLANEWDFMKTKTESDFVRFGEIVSGEDPYRHLLSIHNGARFFNHALPWISHVSVQNGSAVEDPARAELYRDVYRKPVVYDEVKYEGHLSRRWGNLSGEEMVFRFWNGTVAGTYVGHGETLSGPDGATWLSKGGTLMGQSPVRLEFLKRVLAEAPPEGIEPIDRWQNPEYGGHAPDYYLVYLGRQTPAKWEFKIPKATQENGRAPAEGMNYSAEVLDTWNMTVTPVDGVFTLKRMDAYFFADKDARAIPLPGKPYIAIRIKRVD